MRTMPEIDVPLRRLRFGETARRDAWWLPQAASFTILLAFIVYATWAAFQGAYYSYGPDLSPFYSPLLFGGQEAWFGAFPSWVPRFVTPALIILWMPGGFRVTCYYYRGAYYKSFWADPPGCAVGEPRDTYLGERSFPLILQNVHRYFLYLALAFIVLLALDAWRGFWFDGHFGIGVGSLVLLANVILLSCYTLGCHSLRHLVGGRKDIHSDKPITKACYDCVSGLNRRHMLFAWLSLFCVALTDVYVRLCSMGIISDWRIV
jgi:hypothetical protein